MKSTFSIVTEYDKKKCTNNEMKKTTDCVGDED